MRRLLQSARVVIMCLLTASIGLSIIACRPQESDLSFVTIEQRELSATGREYDDVQPGLIVVTTSDQAAKLDAMVTPSARSTVQNLEYDKYFALAVFQGKKPSTRYNAQIERITRLGDTVIIYAKFQEPRPDEAKGDAITSPYHLVQVEKGETWGRPITFEVVVAGTTVVSISQ